MIDLDHTSKKIQVGNKYIQTYTFGEGERSILALASFPHSGLYYRWLLSHQDLSKFRFIVFDIPGWIGKSNGYKNGEKCSLFEITDIAEAVFAHYCKPTEKVGLIGYSFGAPLAIKIASDNPDIIDRLVIVSAIVNTTAIRHKYKTRTEICKTLHLGWLIKRRTRNMFKRYSEALVNSEISDFLTDYGNMLEKTDEQVLLDTIYDIMHIDWTPYLDKIKNKKVLVVNSTKEDKLFREQARIIRLKLNHDMSMYLDGNHSDFLLKPDDDVLKQILDFLDC